MASEHKKRRRFITGRLDGDSIDDHAPKRNKPLPSSKTDFEHDPLDYDKASIRLVQVLPELSLEGYIRCGLRHTTVEATYQRYTCLSYVWGDSSGQRHSILINGKHFHVHDNLWQFLSIARTKYNDISLWIDAICIDQDTILERNHQVQQMGQIFSRAKRVIAWLGVEAETSRCLADIRENPAISLGGNSSRLSDEARRLIRGLGQLSKVEYWQRAWITQEVALAQTITFASGYEELDRALLPSDPKDSFYSKADTLSRIMSLGKDYLIRQMLDQLCLTKHNCSLVYLLALYSDKKCKLKRDRIFSILSMCTEGSDLQPDYRISDNEVIVQTLRHCSSSLCFCTISEMSRGLYETAHDPLLLPASNRWNNLIEFELAPAWGHTAFFYHSDRGICVECEEDVPGAWCGMKTTGEIFCLGSICKGFRTHLYCRVLTGTTEGEVFCAPHIEHSYLRSGEPQLVKVNIRQGTSRPRCAYSIQINLKDILTVVSQRSRWWHLSHIYELERKGPLKLREQDAS